MHRHLIAGALACFSSNLFAQNLDSAANQASGTIQDGVQRAQDTVQPARDGVQRAQDTVQRAQDSVQSAQDSVQSARDGVQRAQETVDRNVQQTSDSSVQRDSQNQLTPSAQNQANAASGQPGQSSSSFPNQNQRPSTLQGQQNGQSNNQGRNSEASQFNGQRDGQVNGALQNRQLMQTPTPMQMSNGQQSSPQQNSGRVYVLRFDANGREFICVDGRPIYFDIVNSVRGQGNSANPNEYRSGYGSYDSQNSGVRQESGRGNLQLDSQQRNSGAGQESNRIRNEIRANDAPQVRGNIQDESGSKNLNQTPFDKSSESAKRPDNTERPTDVDTSSDASKSSERSEGLAQPKL